MSEQKYIQKDSNFNEQKTVYGVKLSVILRSLSLMQNVLPIFYRIKWSKI